MGGEKQRPQITRKAVLPKHQQKNNKAKALGLEHARTDRNAYKTIIGDSEGWTRSKNKIVPKTGITWKKSNSGMNHGQMQSVHKANHDLITGEILGVLP